MRYGMNDALGYRYRYRYRYRSNCLRQNDWKATVQKKWGDLSSPSLCHGLYSTQDDPQAEVLNTRARLHPRKINPIEVKKVGLALNCKTAEVTQISFSNLQFV